MGPELMRGGRRTAEMQATLAGAFAAAVITAQLPRSRIAVALHVLAADGAVLAACVNAGTLALVDAGVPMRDYVVACTAGSTASSFSHGSGAGGRDEDAADPLLDLSAQEELELPFLTVGTLGARVSVLVLETRVPLGRVEGMLAVGVDGCMQVREILDGVVRRHGKRLLENSVG